VLPIVRWPITCPSCRGTAPLTAYDLRQGAIYTCTGCQALLRAAMWRTETTSSGHLRWLVPLSEEGASA
jgi:hypothetical protein